MDHYNQVVEAALFDFVFCGGDRHTQNVFIDEVRLYTLNAVDPSIA